MTFNHLQGELRSYSGLGLIERVNEEGQAPCYRLLFDVNSYLSIIDNLLPLAGTDTPTSPVAMTTTSSIT